MGFAETNHGKGEIASRFATEDGNRQSSLNRARLCAALSKPAQLPPEGYTGEDKLPEAYQSMGNWGVTNFVGSMHFACFTPGLPWWILDLPPEITFNPNIDDRQKQDWLNDLFAFQVSIQSLVEACHLDDSEAGNRLAAGFYSRQYASLTQLAVTGDTLDLLMDDYRLKVFRRDKYVTKRDDCGDVLYHITSEQCDPMNCLDQRQREKAKLKDSELKDMQVGERLTPLHTLIEWQPWTHTWVISQEVNGFVVNTSQESVSPYLSTPYELVAGEDYGRGFVEQNLGDLRTLNNLERRIIDFAALCSKFHPCPDQSCQVDREDLKSDSGNVIEGFRVAGGEIQDLAWMKVDKYPDFRVVHDTVVRKMQSLARTMQIESEMTPQKERTTMFQVQRVVQQLQTSTGGLYSTIQDQKQIPLARRLAHVSRKKGILAKWPDRVVQVKVLTGMAAVAKQAKLGSILGALDVLGRLNPNIAQRIDEQTLIDTIFRYSNVTEPGLVKSDAQMAAERQQAINSQVQLAAGEKGADVAGDVAGAVLTQALTGQAA